MRVDKIGQQNQMVWEPVILVRQRFYESFVIRNSVSN